MFARRRLRMFPLDFGNSTYMVSIPLRKCPDQRSLRKISAHLRLSRHSFGRIQAGPRDGVYKLLEINSRVWWFVEFTGRCGIDMCSMWYRDALDLPLEDIKTYALGAKFVHAYYDFHAIRALWRQANRDPVSRIQFVQCARALLQLDRPMPALYDLRERLHIRRRLLKPGLAANEPIRGADADARGILGVAGADLQFS